MAMSKYLHSRSHRKFLYRKISKHKKKMNRPNVEMWRYHQLQEAQYWLLEDYHAEKDGGQVDEGPIFAGLTG